VRGRGVVGGAYRRSRAGPFAIAEANALVFDPPFPFTEQAVRVTVVGEAAALQAAYADVENVSPVTVE
jgi:hypothetical protein